MPHYSQILNQDGSFNTSAIMQIAVMRARNERNARLCDKHGISFSRTPGLSLGDAAEFYRKEAAKIKIRRYVGEWNDFLKPQLRAVWEIAHAMHESRQAA